MSKGELAKLLQPLFLDQWGGHTSKLKASAERNDMARAKYYRRVLNKSLTTLIDDLDPAPILDEFIVHDFLQAIQIRDIQEITTTSEKNRAIVQIVKTKGLKGYGQFKEFLCNTEQEHLADYLGKLEKQVQEEKIVKPVQAVEDNLDAAPRSGQNVLNIGGQNAMNIYGGNVTVTGNITFGGEGMMGAMAMPPSVPASSTSSVLPPPNHMLPPPCSYPYHPYGHRYPSPYYSQPYPHLYAQPASLSQQFSDLHVADGSATQSDQNDVGSRAPPHQ